MNRHVAPTVYDFLIRTWGPNGHSMLPKVEQAASVFSRLQNRESLHSIVRDVNAEFGVISMTYESVRAFQQGCFHIHAKGTTVVLSNQHVLPEWQMTRFWDLTQVGLGVRKDDLPPSQQALLGANKFYILGPPAPKPHELAVNLNAGEEKRLIISEALWLLQQDCAPVFVADFVWWRTGKVLPLRDVINLRVFQAHNQGFHQAYTICMKGGYRTLVDMRATEADLAPDGQPADRTSEAQYDPILFGHLKPTKETVLEWMNSGVTLPGNSGERDQNDNGTPPGSGRKSSFDLDVLTVDRNNSVRSQDGEVPGSGDPTTLDGPDGRDQTRWPSQADEQHVSCTPKPAQAIGWSFGTVLSTMNNGQSGGQAGNQGSDQSKGDRRPRRGKASTNQGQPNRQQNKRHHQNQTSNANQSQNRVQLQLQHQHQNPIRQSRRDNIANLTKALGETNPSTVRAANAHTPHLPVKITGRQIPNRQKATPAKPSQKAQAAQKAPHQPSKHDNQKLQKHIGKTSPLVTVDQLRMAAVTLRRRVARGGAQEVETGCE